MTLLVRAFPVVCDRSEVEKLTAEMNERSADVRRFYESFGVTRESWFLQETEHGPMVIGVTEVNDLETAAQDYAQTTEHFAAWFKSRVKEISGIDPNEQPLGPPTEKIFEFNSRSAAAEPPL